MLCALSLLQFRRVCGAFITRLLSLWTRPCQSCLQLVRAAALQSTRSAGRMAAELPDGLVLDTARSAVSSSGRFTPSSFFAHDEDTPCESSAPTAAAAGHPHAEAGASPTAHWQEEPDAKRRKLPEQGGAAVAPVACADVETSVAELHDATVVTAIQSTILCIRNAAFARQAPALHIPSAAVPDWPHCIPLLCLTGHPNRRGAADQSTARHPTTPPS
jgi:hypothetical protein